MNILENIPAALKGFKGVSFKKNLDFLAVDVSGEILKIVHSRELTGKRTILNVASQKFDENQEVEAIQYLRALRKEWGIVGNRVIGVVPSQFFIARNIDMPSNNRDEIAKIINLQVGRFTPYSRDEIVIDYLCREVQGQHYTNVLLIIVNRKVIEKYYRLLESATYWIEKLVIASEGLAMLPTTFPELADISKTVGVLHLSESTSDFTILEEGQMVFVRSIPVGNQNFDTNKTVAQTEFINEVNKSIAAYQDEGIGKPLQSLLLSGVTNEVESLRTAITAKVPAVQSAKAEVKLVDYPRLVGFSEQAIHSIDSEKQTSYLELVVTLLTQNKLQIDLIPKEDKLKRRVREGARDIITLGILIMTLFLLISCLLMTKIYFRNVKIEKLDAINESTFGEARLLERVSTKNRVVRKMLEGRGRGLYVFDKITALIGEDIYLTQFSYDQGGNLTIVGTADSMSRVFAFVTQLEESNYFSAVKTNETKSRREGQKEVADFNMTCTLAPGF